MVLEKFVESLGELFKFTTHRKLSFNFFLLSVYRSMRCNSVENAYIMGKVLSAAPLLMCLKACGQWLFNNWLPSVSPESQTFLTMEGTIAIHQLLAVLSEKDSASFRLPLHSASGLATIKKAETEAKRVEGKKTVYEKNTRINLIRK